MNGFEESDSTLNELACPFLGRPGQWSNCVASRCHFEGESGVSDDS